MAFQAFGAMVGGAISGGEAAVGVMAGGTGQAALALKKAARLTQPVCGADDFELFVVARAGGVIEVDHVLAQRLAGYVSIKTAPESTVRIGQAECSGFEMTLHADFELTFSREARGVHDGAGNLPGGFALAGGGNLCRS
jgi:hypothetical protein